MQEPARAVTRDQIKQSDIVHASPMECSNIKIQSDLTQQRHKDEALTTSKSYPGKMDGTRCVRLANKNRLLAIRTVSPAVPCKSFFEPASSWAKECTPVVSVLQMPRSMTCQWQRKEKVGDRA